MDESWIGLWVTRFSRRTHRAISRSHKVESVIENRLVTRCGRQMRRFTTDGYLSETGAYAAKGCTIC